MTRKHYKWQAHYGQDADATPHEVGTKAMKACWKSTHDP